MSALSIPIGEKGSIPLLTLTLTTIMSMQLQNKHTSRPLHHQGTPNQHYCIKKCTRLNNNLWNKNQKEWHWLPNIIKYHSGQYRTLYLAIQRSSPISTPSQGPTWNSHWKYNKKTEIFYSCIILHSCENISKVFIMRTYVEMNIFLCNFPASCGLYLC